MTNTNNKKLHALADYLDISAEDIQLENEDSNDKYNEYRTEIGTYLVMDEEESKQAVYDDIENLIDDLGIYDLFNPEFIDWIEDEAMDQDWFEDWFYEDYRMYAKDIESEEDDEYGNRLNQECVECKLIRPDEIVNGEYRGQEDLYELLAEYLVNSIRESTSTFSKEFKFQLGKDGLRAVIKEHPHIVDINTIIDECIRLDGYGHNLSSWDGKTLELEDDLYAYKQSDYDEREK